MSHFKNLSVLLIRFSLSEDTNEIERLTSAGIPEGQIYQATINDTLTGGISLDIDVILLKLDECARFNWQQLYSFLDATVTWQVPVMACYKSPQQSQEVNELTSSYSHIKLVSKDEGIENFKSKLNYLMTGDSVKWDEDPIELEPRKSNSNRSNGSNGHLISYLSHEIKTPLSAVIGYTEELLENEDLDDKTRRDLKKIYSNSYQVLHVMNSVMEFPGQFLNARVDRMETVYIDEIVREIVDWQSRESDNPKVTLRHQVDESFNDGIISEEGSIRQILINLVNNALDHTDEGTIEICANPVDSKAIQQEREDADYVSLDRLSKNRESSFLEIEIEDEGKGIEPASMETIFDHGVSDKSNDQMIRTNGESGKQEELHYSNFGIGLSVIRQLIEQQNGFLAVKSKPGAGSKFTVILPYEVVSSGKDTAKEAQASAEDEESKELHQRIAREAKELGEEWFEEFKVAIGGLDLNQIIMLCDRNVDDKPALNEVFEAAVFKNFQYLVEVQSAFLLDDTEGPVKGDKSGLNSHKSYSIAAAESSIQPVGAAYQLMNRKNGSDRIKKKLEVI